jgi:hypothetical protein
MGRASLLNPQRHEVESNNAEREMNTKEFPDNVKEIGRRTTYSAASVSVASGK